MTAADLKESLAQLEHEHLNIMATLNACRGAIQQTKHYISLAEQVEARPRPDADVTASTARIIDFPAASAVEIS